MALTITDTRITSDQVSCYAQYSQHADADGRGAWVIFAGPAEFAWGYGGRLFDRNQAISAMTIEEEKTRPEPNRTLIASLEGELH